MTSSLETERHAKRVNLYRGIMIFNALIYPPYAKNHLETFPNDWDPMWARLIVSGIFVTGALLSFTNRFFKKHTLAMLHFGMYALTIHLFIVAKLSEFRMFMLWAMTASLLMAAAFFYTRIAQAIFGFIVIVGSYWLIKDAPQTDVPLGFFLLVNTSAVVFLNIFGYFRYRQMRELEDEIELRKKTELKLKESQSLLSNVLDHSPAAVYLKDLRGNYLLVNREFNNVFLPSSQTWEALDRKVVEDRTAVHTEDSFVLNQEKRIFFATRFPVFNQNNQMYAVGGILLDITEKRRAEESARENEVRMVAASKLSALGEMAAGIAHEINNPLTILQGQSYLMRLKSQKNELGANELSEMVDVNIRTVERIAKIIKGLRNFARESQGEPLKPTNVSAMLSETLQLCEQRFVSHKIELKVVAPDQNLTVPMRSVEISQVLVNLLNNSFDAVEEREQKWIQVEVRQAANELQLIVTDNGERIPDNVAEKMMQPFFTTKPIGRGTGLGLSISKGIIEAHSGSLVYRADQTHTCFVASIPLQQPTEATGNPLN